MTQKKQLFENVCGRNDAVHLWIVEDTPCARQKLVTVAHCQLLLANLHHAASRVIHSQEHEPAVRRNVRAALSSFGLLLRHVWPPDTQFRDFIKHFCRKCYFYIKTHLCGRLRRRFSVCHSLSSPL